MTDSALPFDPGGYGVEAEDIAPLSVQTATIKDTGGDTRISIPDTTPTLFYDEDNQVAFQAGVGFLGSEPALRGPDNKPLRLQPHSSQSLAVHSPDTTQVLQVSDSAIQVTSSARPLLFQDDTRLVFGTGSDSWLQGEMVTGLTDAAANTIFSVAMSDDTWAGMTVAYTIECSDGTDYQTEHGNVEIAMVQTAAAGPVVDLNETADTATAVTTGTLTSSWTADTTDDGSIEIQLTPNSSLTPTTLQVRWCVIACQSTSRTITPV